MIQENIPQHVVMIPDGNRRWAKLNGKTTYEGHKKGIDSFHEVSLHAADRGVRHISIWGMSINNFTKRSVKEINDLLRIFQDQFQSLITSEDIHKRQVKINVLGRWREKFPPSLNKTIDEAMDVTKNYHQAFLNFFLAYNGTDEMIRAIQSIVDSKQSIITPEVIKQNLMTRDLPPVDLMIRTGGEPHLSTGFMMWDTSDAELYFTGKYWPDFSNQEFDLALADYSSRRRRKGK